MYTFDQCHSSAPALLLLLLFSCVEKQYPIQGNSSDTQICMEEFEASDDANTELDLTADYPSDSTEDAFDDY